MDELLLALQKGDTRAVSILAAELFITKAGLINRVEKNVFERFAPCKMYPLLGTDEYWTVGAIVYNGKQYSFGGTANAH